MASAESPPDSRAGRSLTDCLSRLAGCSDIERSTTLGVHHGMTHGRHRGTRHRAHPDATRSSLAEDISEAMSDAEFDAMSDAEFDAMRRSSRMTPYDHPRRR